MSNHSHEIWRAIPGTDGLYSVSSLGRVRSEPLPGRTGRQRGRILKPSINRKGYSVFRVCLPSGMKWQTSIHRAVAAAFLGPCEIGLQVDHINGDKTDNRPENLEYVTCKENIRRCWANGLHSTDYSTGESNNNAKLNDAKVREIRGNYPAKSLYVLASEYGVSPQCVWFIVKGKTWKHVTEKTHSG